MIEITFDPEKRLRTMVERGLDFADAAVVFSGRTYTGPDERFAYGEPRYITVGHLGERMIVPIWTPRDGTRRIISMRKANEREQAWYAHHLGEPGR